MKVEAPYETTRLRVRAADGYESKIIGRPEADLADCRYSVLGLLRKSREACGHDHEWFVGAFSGPTTPSSLRVAEPRARKAAESGLGYTVLEHRPSRASSLGIVKLRYDIYPPCLRVPFGQFPSGERCFFLLTNSTSAFSPSR